MKDVIRNCRGDVAFDAVRRQTADDCAISRRNDVLEVLPCVH